jgi:hypothetical protein
MDMSAKGKYQPYDVLTLCGLKSWSYVITTEAAVRLMPIPPDDYETRTRKFGKQLTSFGGQKEHLVIFIFVEIIYQTLTFIHRCRSGQD